jgi:hypothetical protein
MERKPYDMSIHTNPDARAWAKFFVETSISNGWKMHDIDEDLMICWFANAMMAMHDHLKGNHVQLLPDGSAFFVADV